MTHGLHINYVTKHWLEESTNNLINDSWEATLMSMFGNIGGFSSLEKLNFEGLI